MSPNDLTLVLGLVYAICGIVIVWGFARWMSKRRDRKLAALQKKP